MEFGTDDENLSVWIQLDDEPVDLTHGGLGAQILDAAVSGMMESSFSEQSPEGRAWAPLKTRTILQKGSDRVGVESGDMLNPRRFTGGDRDIEPRQAIWTYQHGGQGTRSWGKAHGFHNGRPEHGQPARRIFGWTDQAKRIAAELVAGVAQNHQLDGAGDFHQGTPMAGGDYLV